MRSHLRRTAARLLLQHGISEFDSLNDAQPCQIYAYVRAVALHWPRIHPRQQAG